MGGMTQGGFNFQGPNTQQMAANNVKATKGSSPSLGQMQQGMGGLMTNETQQQGFDTFMSGIMSQFAPAFGGIINSGFDALGMERPQEPVMPAAEPPPAEVPPPKDLTAEDDPDMPDWYNRYRSGGPRGLLQTDRTEKAMKRAKKVASLLAPGMPL